jgi:hypothetical protein
VRFFPILILASLAAAQAPRIGIIDFYGLRKVSESRVRRALGVTEGDPLPASKGDVETRLDGLGGVVEAQLEAVCCENGKMILYVGIEERGTPHFERRESPEGDIRLSADVLALYQQFLQALEIAARKGDTADDVTRGHSLLANPEARAIQQQFIPIAKDRLEELRKVLRSSGDEEHRAAAAFIIGYAPHKSEIVGDLQFALRDPSSAVRNNAVRALGAFAVLARLDPQSSVKVSPTWFIEMLNSVDWTDRNKAVWVLQTLTDNRDASVLDQLRERAMPSLVEMARWKSLGHALPAYMLVGRIAGIPDEELQERWSKGEREAVIAQALKKKK